MKTVPLMLACLTAFSLPATASAWSPLRAENPKVNEGNAFMAEGQYAEALEAYDEAARELPEARSIQLNRGLALLGQEQLGEQAKEAFAAAADPSAPPEIRADAYYNLGVAFARDGDSISQQEEFEQASAQYREAADAFKRALRLRPGDRNAAWNLEYAQKRIREAEEKQQEQQQEQQQDPQNQEPQEQEPQEGEDGSEDSQQDPQSQDSQEEPEQEQDPQPSDAESQTEAAEQPMQPDDVQRFLDALEQNEENLPLQRARRRSAGRPPPEKDW